MKRLVFERIRLYRHLMKLSIIFLAKSVEKSQQIQDVEFLKGMVQKNKHIHDLESSALLVIHYLPELGQVT